MINTYLSLPLTRAKEKAQKRKSKKEAKSKLSFAMDDDEEDAGEEAEVLKPSSKKLKTEIKKIPLKNPTVDTSFLPDREREEKDRLAREELRQEWLKKQEVMKSEEIEIIYSYWDGSGHRKSLTVG